MRVYHLRLPSSVFYSAFYRLLTWIRYRMGIVVPALDWMWGRYVVRQPDRVLLLQLSLPIVPHLPGIAPRQRRVHILRWNPSIYLKFKHEEFEFWFLHYKKNLPIDKDDILDWSVWNYYCPLNIEAPIPTLCYTLPFFDIATDMRY